MKNIEVDQPTKPAPVGEPAGDGAHQAIDRLSEAAHPAISRATSGAHHLVDRISDTSGRVAQQVAKSASRLKDTEHRLIGAGSNYVREHPLKSTGIALAAGFLVSQLVSLRKASARPEEQ